MQRSGFRGLGSGNGSIYNVSSRCVNCAFAYFAVKSFIKALAAKNTKISREER
jgi:hypothetical protein